MGEVSRLTFAMLSLESYKRTPREFHFILYGMACLPL